MKLVCVLSLIALLHSSVSNSYAADQEVHTHRTAESFARSGYEYLWSVIQDEFDQTQFENSDLKKQYRNKIDIMIRTGCTYSQPYRNSGFGIRDLYPEILKLHSEPPLYVQYRYHSSQSQKGYDFPDDDFEGHAIALFQIAEQMKERSYPDYIIGATLLRSAEFFRDAGLKHDERAQAASHDGIQTLLKAATLEQIEPEYQEYVAIRIARNGWRYSALTDENKELFCKKLLESEHADPWIGLYAIGQLNRKRAWASRGSGWAREVTDEQWELFGRYMKLSNQYLVDAWELRPQWPEPAVELIGNTMGAGPAIEPNQNEFFWFNEVIQVRSDHERAYIKYVYALSPRWGGSIESMLELTQYVIDLSDEIDHMSYILQECMSAIAKEVESEDAKRIAHALCPTMTRLIYEEINEPLPYKNIWQHTLLLRTIAKFNFMSGEYEHCSEILKAGGMKRQKLFSPWVTHEPFTSYSMLLSSEVSDLTIKALHAIDDNDLDQAEDLLSEAIVKLEDSSFAIHPELDRWKIIYTLEDLIYELKN